MIAANQPLGIRPTSSNAVAMRASDPAHDEHHDQR